MTVSKEFGAVLLRFARETIAGRFTDHAPEPPSTENHDFCGCFVTLKKDGKLRGCIGRMTSDEPLVETVRKMALAAAFDDPRFPGLARQELESIHIEISILSPLEKITHASSIVVGTHGILVRGYGRSGVLLPQVPLEWGWDRDTFMAQVLLKAGMPNRAFGDPGLTFEVFTATVLGEE